MFVSDLRHFLDLSPETPGPARRMAEHLTLIVRAATAGDAGIPWVSALTCRRRPGRRPCPGHLALSRSDVPPSIAWQCTSCGDEGVISGWERSPFDLRTHGSEGGSAPALVAIIPSEVAVTLRGLMFLDATTERLVFRASVSDDGILLSGQEEELEELTDCVAAEANHEGDRRRQRQLDAAYDVLTDALKQP